MYKYVSLNIYLQKQLGSIRKASSSFCCETKVSQFFSPSPLFRCIPNEREHLVNMIYYLLPNWRWNIERVLAGVKSRRIT